MSRWAKTAWAAPFDAFLRLMGQEGRAGYAPGAAAGVIAGVVARAGKAPASDRAGAWFSTLFWYALTRPRPRVELIARRWMVWTAPRLLPDRVTDWAVRGLFGL